MVSCQESYCIKVDRTQNLSTVVKTISQRGFILLNMILSIKAKRNIVLIKDLVRLNMICSFSSILFIFGVVNRT